MMVLVIASSWAAPGLLLALIVAMLGTAAGNKSFTGAGIAFLALFIAAYFYGIETTMLTKSYTLVGSGAAVLLARWVLLKAIPAEEQGELQHG